MRRITRYILAEFVKIFALTLVVISTLMIVALVLVEFTREGLAPLSILRLLPYAAPMALLFAIPGTTLFAVCYVYGQMSAANEITAVKAAGISPLTMVKPILVLAFLLSLLVVWLNDVAVSWGRVGMNRVVLESVEQVVYGMLRRDKACSMRRFSIHVRGVAGQKLLQPTIRLQVDEQRPPMICLAQEAELHSDPVAETLRIVMRDCEITCGKFHANFPDEFVQVIPLADATRRSTESSRPSDTLLRRIPAEINRQLAQIEQLERTLAAEAAVQMFTGDLAGLADSQWDSRHGQIRLAISRLHRLQTEPWRRFANGFSCFFFVLAGAPIAIRLRTAFVWTTFLVCLLTILLPYYLVMMYSTGLAKSGSMPAYIVWLGNGVMVVAGYTLVRQMQRY